MKTNYTPISCELYDRLEAAATLNLICQIIYLDENNKPTYIKDEIKDIYASVHEEYIKLLSEKITRLDKLISFNGSELRTLY